MLRKTIGNPQPERKNKAKTKAAGAIIKNTFWMLFDKVFILLLNLIVTVRVANHFGKLEYGSYEYAVSIVAILEILVSFVDGRVVKKYYQEYDGDVLVWNATVCRVLFSGISAVIGILYILYKGRGDAFSIMFTILLVNAILTNLRFGMANRFEYLLKSKKTVIAADLSAFIGGLLQLAVVKMNGSLIALSTIAAITSAINLIIIFAQYRIEFGGGKRQLDKTLVVKMIRESLPLAVAASCATIYTKCDSVMLGDMLSDAAVGIYAISVKLITVVQIAVVPVRESVYPKLMQLYADDRKLYAKLYVRITSMMTWIYIVGTAISFVVLPFVFTFFSQDYAESLPIYKIHVMGAFFMYNAALRAGHYTLIKRGDILMYAQIASVFINIALNVIGIKLWGMYGAALATVTTQGISLFASNIFFGQEGREVFIWQLKALNPIHILR